MDRTGTVWQIIRFSSAVESEKFSLSHRLPVVTNSFFQVTVSLDVSFVTELETWRRRHNVLVLMHPSALIHLAACTEFLEIKGINNTRHSCPPLKGKPDMTLLLNIEIFTQNYRRTKGIPLEPPRFPKVYQVPLKICLFLKLSFGTLVH